MHQRHEPVYQGSPRGLSRDSLCDNNLSHQAALYGSSGKKTPIFLRFSTVTFGREFPDSGRNPRGFAIKHYTEEGNYDMVGLNFVCAQCLIPLCDAPDIRLAHLLLP